MHKNNKVFCIGFSKTGTTSLEKALNHLGYKMYTGRYDNYVAHWLYACYIYGDYDEILRITDIYDAFADAPWGGTDVYKHVYRKHPDSKYILTLRDTEEWYESFCNMCLKFSNDLNTCFDDFYTNGRYSFGLLFQKIFNIDVIEGNEYKIKHIYDAYNQNCMGFLEKNNADYITLNIDDEYKWEKVCKFLDKSVPNMPFPHANRAINKDTSIKHNEDFSMIDKLKRIIISNTLKK